MGFKEDNENAKPAEYIVRSVLAAASLKLAKWKVDWNVYFFEDVSEDEEFHHKGDIEVTDSVLEDKTYIDVKDDGVICSSHNIFAEDKNYWRETGSVTDGYMKTGEYDYVAICSQPDKKIYILDFKEWQKHYRKGRLVPSYHPENIAYGYIMKLDYARKLGIVKFEIDYEKSFDWWLDDKGKEVLTLYEPIKIKRYDE